MKYYRISYLFKAENFDFICENVCAMQCLYSTKIQPSFVKHVQSEIDTSGNEVLAYIFANVQVCVFQKGLHF